MLRIICTPSRMTYYLIVLLFLAINIFLASRNITSIPLVDGWALWNQLMLLDLGEISFFDYTFSYFGSHPHSIIKLLSWLDYRFTGGRQLLTAAISLLCFALYGCFLANLFFSWAKKNLQGSSYVLIIGIIIALLSTDLADWEVTTLPFQSVLSISRFFYIFLLWLFLSVLKKGTGSQLRILAVAAGIATTFHGAGFIFAILWLIIGLVHCRRIQHLATSFLPIAVWFLQAYFYKNSSELNGVSNLVSLEGITNFITAFLVYFATPLSPFYDTSNKEDFIFFGLIMAIFTIYLALLGMLRLFRFRSVTSGSKAQIDELSYAGVLCTFVLLSGLAASALMVVRAGPLADLYVLTTSRYISYATLPYILFVIFLAQLSQKFKKIQPVCITGITLVLLISAYPTLSYERIHSPKLGLDKAVALISAGVSPLEVDAMFIWPNAKDDWYWVSALPKTTSYLKQNRTGPWHNLPRLGDSYSGSTKGIPIEDLVYSNPSTIPDSSLSAFEGTLKKRIPSSYLDSGVFPILDEDGLVVGFAYQKQASDLFHVAGIVNRKIGHKLDNLHIGPRDGSYIGKALTSSLGTH